VRAVRVEGDTRFSDKVVREVAGVEPGAPVDGAELARIRERLAGLGVFEHIDVGVEPVEGEPGLADVVLRPIEKDWGPNYLRFRIGASSDLEGSGDFDLGVQHTWTPANGFGGEWRNEVQLGTFTRLFTEFYQPLDPRLRWFLAPSVEYAQDDLPLIVDEEKVAEVNLQGVDTSLALGRNLGDWGEARVGYGYARATAEPEIAVPGLLPEETKLEGGRLTSRLAIDTLDSIRFARKGFLGDVDWEYTDDGFGGDTRLSRLDARVAAPLTFGPVTFRPLLEGGTTFEGETSFGGEFFLGGFQRLSGLELRQLSGNHYALGVAQVYWQLSERTTRYSPATYLGASLELGGIWQARDDVNGRDLILASSVFAALDSLLGPIYLGFGWAEGGQQAAYLFIEPVF
ncbi:MAG TPA: POTRA domain-containing protein, partial [Planctomycetota bacterium]|nr:POTRA domain-containing protein [Planctomycetota bacterium]